MPRGVFFGLGGLPLVVAAVLAATNAVAQSTPDPPQPLTSITVTITSVDRVAGGDPGSPPASLPDYYGRVFIGTTAEMSGTSTDQSNITPNWTFTRSSIPRYGGPVPIRIEIKDDDNPNTDPNADEAVDVDHFAPGA